MTEPANAGTLIPESAQAPTAPPDLAPLVGAVMQSPDFGAYLAGLESAAIEHATARLGAAGPLAAFLGKAFVGYALARIFRS